MNGLNSLPVRFAWFADGLHIVRAHAGFSELIGTRVTSYGGQDPEVLYKALDPYFGSNDAFLRQNTAFHFAAPAAMHAAGLIEQADRVELELMDMSGEASSVTLQVEDVATRVFGVHRYALSRAHEREIESGHDWRFLDAEITEST